MSKFAGFIIGAIEIGIGIATGNVALIVQGGMTIALQAIVDLTAPKEPAREASEMTIKLGEGPRVMLVGETFTPGSLVDAFDYGGKYGTDWEVLIIRLADHKCQSLTGFYVNDDWVPYTSDGVVPRYHQQLKIYFRGDTSTDPLPAIVLDHGLGWTAADIGRSGCDVIVAYKADKPKAKHPIWPAGRPRFGFVVKGKLQYDRRKDDDVPGGSGPHRPGDPSTWEWSENAIVCWDNYERGVFAEDDTGDLGKLLVGRGLSAGELAPNDLVIAAANICDEVQGTIYPYDIRSGAGSGVGGGGFSPDGALFYQQDTAVLFVWDVLTRTKIAEVPLAGGDITIGEDGVYAKAGFLPASSQLWHYGPDGREAIKLLDGFAVFVGPPRHAAGELYFLAGTINETNIGHYVGGLVTAIALTFSTTHIFEGPGSTAWAVGPDAATANNLSLAQIPPAMGTPAASRATGAGAGPAYGMWNGAGGLVVWQNGHLYLFDATTLAFVTSATVGGSSTYADNTFNNVAPGAATIWIGNTEYDTRTLATLRSVVFANWIDQLITGTVYDRINHAIISHELATDELTWRFLDRHGGYRVAGPVYSNQPFIEVEQMFAAATGGSILTREGAVFVEPGQVKSVVATITDADLIVGSKVNWNQGFLSESSDEWLNTVVAKYVERDQKWNSHDAPVLRSSADIVADGKPREAAITLRLVRYLGQALRIAEISRRLGRLWGRATITLGPRFCELEDGDWIQWRSDRHFNGGTKTLRIDAYSIDEKWQNTLTLREINGEAFAADGIYPADHSTPTTTPPPPDIGTPDAGNWALAAVTLDSPGASIPALEITGSGADDDYAEAIIFEYWKWDGATDPAADPNAIPWTLYDGHGTPDTTKVDITSIVGGATYFAAVSYVVGGEIGDRLVLGPVTVADHNPIITLEDGLTPLQLEDGATPFHVG
jgi:hypothetical protein